MKKIVLLTLIFGVLLTFSCKKNEGAQGSQGAVEGFKPVDAAVSSRTNPGYIIRIDASFLVIDNDTGSQTDTARWILGMSLGESVYTGEIRKGTSNGTVYDLIEVRRDDGREGYAFVNQVAVGGRLAVVIDENGANLYKAPRAVEVSGTVLSRKTIVVYYPETESGGFVEIKGYDIEKQTYVRTTESYIRLTSLSRRDADIQSAILLQTAMPLANSGATKVRRDALLESALLDFPGSIFFEEIQALVNPNTASVIQTERYAFNLTVSEYNAEVRDLPDMVTGHVIGSLEQGADVRASERTTAESTIFGETAHWIKITSPVEGWVFGANLTE